MRLLGTPAMLYLLMNFNRRRYVTFFVGILLALAGLASSAPAAQPAQWVSKGPGGGGALFAPSFNPNSSAEMYLACDMGEVFHSTNFGAAWSVVDFRQIEGGRQVLI